MKQWKGFLCGVLLTLTMVGLIGTAVAWVGTRTAELEYSNINVTLDGVPVSLTDTNGNAVEPFTINGTTYLPVRAVANALDLEVDWDGAARTVILKRRATATPTPAPDTPPSGQITLAEARAEALKHAGLSEKDVTFTKQKTDLENGRQVYEIEFYTKDHKEYDYEIDCATGKILSFDYDAESYTPPAGAQPAITRDKAQEIALSRVPGAKAEHIRKLKLDLDDGRQIYEVKIIYSGTEYDLEIDADNGAVLEFEMEYIYD